MIVPRESVILPTYASIEITAPAAFVWAVLVNTGRYPEWNSFCPKVTMRSQPEGTESTDPNLHIGTSFIFHVVMDSNKPTSYTDTQLRVLDISTPQHPSSYIPQTTLDSEPTFQSDLSKLYRICWTTEGGFVSKGLKSERYHEIKVLGDELCSVRTWECQGGSLARAVKWFYKDTLKQKFADWCEDLKRESEKKFQESKQ
jgi:Polyketide cyclase / dehydrase and lipid transport